MRSLLLATALLAQYTWAYPTGAPIQACGTFTLGAGLFIPSPPLNPNANIYYSSTTLHTLGFSPTPSSPFLVSPNNNGYTNSTTETIRVLNANGTVATAYVPGTTYNVSITAAASFHGLLVGANSEGGASGGDINAIPGYVINGTYSNKTISQFQSLNCPSSKYVTHNGLSSIVAPGSTSRNIGINFNRTVPPSSFGFTVKWTAPAAGTGTVYVAASIVYNSDGLATGARRPAIFVAVALNEVLSGGATRAPPGSIVPVPTVALVYTTTSPASATTTGAAGAGTTTTGAAAVGTTTAQAGNGTVTTTPKKSDASRSAVGGILLATVLLLSSYVML